LITCFELVLLNQSTNTTDRQTLESSLVLAIDYYYLITKFTTTPRAECRYSMIQAAAATLRPSELGESTEQRGLEGSEVVCNIVRYHSVQEWGEQG
jgi:hypothetical protein